MDVSCCLRNANLYLILSLSILSESITYGADYRAVCPRERQEVEAGEATPLQIVLAADSVTQKLQARKATLEQQQIDNFSYEVQQELEQIYGDLKARDADASESLARRILLGLGFPLAWQVGNYYVRPAPVYVYFEVKSLTSFPPLSFLIVLGLYTYVLHARTSFDVVTALQDVFGRLAHENLACTSAFHGTYPTFA
jgi:hypothetical protein